MKSNRKLFLFVSATSAAVAVAIVVAVTAIAFSWVQTTTWWAGYYLQNCPECKPIIDWTDELSKDVVGESEYKIFQRDGVIILPNAVSVDKVNTLAHEADSLPHTFTTDVISNTLLRQYIEYEHRLDSRSELFRDWAVHGPLGQWAAKLMGVDQVRLYNAEKIYSRGDVHNKDSCRPAWHRDVVAAPFPPETPSVTFNVYLDDISGDNDALVYIPGSHHDLSKPPKSVDNPWEPQLKVGDILAHDPKIYHTPSGRGCWRRRSLQFRYVAGPTTFVFGPNRFPHGPVPWTFAHAPGIAPHNLIAVDGGASSDGDGTTETSSPTLEGPLYPLVFPAPKEEEHVPYPGSPWTILGILGVTKQAQDIAQGLGIGQHNCTIGNDNENDDRSNDNKATGLPPSPPAYYGFDGPVTECDGWEMVKGLPVHKDGQMIHTLQNL